MSVFARTTEHTPEGLAQLGRSARDVLENEAFTMALEEVEIHLLERMKLAMSVAERETASRELHALDAVLKALRGIRSAGEYAEKVIENRTE